MEPLDLLSKASTPKVVQDIFVMSFKNRKKPITDREKSGLVSLLGITDQQAVNLLTAVRDVITEALYYNMTAEEIEKFLSGVTDSIKAVIVKILTHYMPSWREAVLHSQVSMPRLKTIDWRIDIKSSSNEMSRMSVPTVIVNLEVEQNPTKIGEAPKMRNIDFELSSEALAVMLEGLGQIKKQLDAIAQ